MAWAPVEFAELAQAGLSHGATRTVSCDAGYSDVLGRTAETVQCSHGIWSDLSLQCSQDACSQYVVDEGYEATCSGVAAGAACALKCADGFAPIAGSSPEARNSARCRERRVVDLS